MNRTVMPIMGSKLIKEIPWEMIAPHEKQAIANHSQTLERLASRGGLACSEAIDIMRGARWSTAAACLENEQYLVRQVEIWKKAQEKT